MNESSAQSGGEEVTAADLEKIKAAAAKEYPLHGMELYDNRGYSGFFRGAQWAYRHLFTHPSLEEWQCRCAVQQAIIKDLRDIVTRAERYLLELNDDNVHDPS